MSAHNEKMEKVEAMAQSEEVPQGEAMPQNAPMTESETASQGEAEAKNGTGQDEPAQAKPVAADRMTAYQVLARKYRPRQFADLIGQEAMVQTLSNAFATGRIAHAFMLTGVRGVGKTTTARILARALNYSSDKINAPTMQLDEMGVHCAAIMAGNHVDIIEMDAASRTGIDDVREIIENVRYLPGQARYKIYIIDEVHMLSKQAFNGLLKTLEEPPDHVKFIFATTEIRKIPVTVLSRCQRFDLRRLTQEEILRLLDRVCTQENVAMSAENLNLIARVAEGSARDALSLLDRALAHADYALAQGQPDKTGGQATTADISADEMRRILGLADRERIADLFDLLMQGDIAAALAEFDTQYAMGADVIAILSDLLDLTHWLTRLKFVAAAGQDITISEAQRQRGQKMAEKLSVRILSRAWQVLLKGYSETLTASNPVAAAEMVLVRLAYLADMPPPEELVKKWQATQAGTKADSADSAPAASSASPASSSSPPLSANVRPEIASTDSTTPTDSAASTTSTASTAPTDSTAPAAPAAPGAPAASTAPTDSTTASESSESAALTTAPASPPDLQDFAQLVAFIAEKRDIRLAHLLRERVHPVRFQPATAQQEGVIEFRPVDGTEDFSHTLSKKLRDWTGRNWQVSLSQEEGQPTLAGEAANAAENRRKQAGDDPLVQAVLTTFPGADIVNVTGGDDQNAAMPVVADKDEDKVSDKAGG